ncbi:hypothetical protein DRO55_05215 [Candidatus Bathyarchaeota archaeon]|nr:MAG: hypothetical protein DRO55_05215 [Candidatus Bathyarchaeota archaeon]
MLKRKRIIFLTGRPGIGKTSVLMKAVDELRKAGYRVGGMISCEVREKGSRVGFKVINLLTGCEGWLAHVNQPKGPKVSKYRVKLEDLETIGAGSIRDAIQTADIIVIDEVGPMELFSEAFKEAVKEAIESDKPVIGTIHYRARDPLIDAIRNRDDAEVVTVTLMNRDRLYKTIVEKILK